MIELYCDGGSRGNPGPAAYGYLVKNNGKVTKKDYAYIGIETNNFAEYTAVTKGLTYLSKQKYAKNEQISVYMDSKLAVSQIIGVYKVKNSAIRNFILTIRMLESSLPKINYTHIPREQNTEADYLVNIALDNKKI